MVFCEYNRKATPLQNFRDQAIATIWGNLVIRGRFLSINKIVGNGHKLMRPSVGYGR